MATAYYGCYKYSFVDKIDLEKFTCTVCTKVSRNPRQTGCCGQVICRSCLYYWFSQRSGRKSCPHCQAKGGGNFKDCLDTSLKHESQIDSLKIHCTNKDGGCEWIGELGSLKDHLESAINGCHYVKVECPRKCGKINRKHVTDHLKSRCSLRPYNCEYCGFKDTYANITGHGGKTDYHYLKCLEYPLECPCGRKSIKRKDMKEHTEHCSQKKVNSPNKFASQYRRLRMFTHLKYDHELEKFKCKYCGLLIENFSVIPTKHHDICKQFPLECPNKCGVKDIKRKDIEDHLSLCPEEEVECPNKCQTLVSKLRKVKRKVLKDHLANECELRQYQCQHCELENTFKAITTTHYAQCPEFPLRCPKKCSFKYIKRKDMKNHCSQCPEELVECTYGCEVYYIEKSIMVMRRKNLEKHLREECPLRPYQCQYCGLIDKYTTITTEHYGKCANHYLECPNKCGVTRIMKKYMENHRSRCPQEPVQCPFEDAGCKEKLVRCELELHMSDTQQQHRQLIKELKISMVKLTQRNSELESTNSERNEEENLHLILQISNLKQNISEMKERQKQNLEEISRLREENKLGQQIMYLHEENSRLRKENVQLNQKVSRIEETMCNPRQRSTHNRWHNHNENRRGLALEKTKVCVSLMILCSCIILAFLIHY